MAYRLELSDLPPRYRAQAEAQLAGRGKKRGDTVTAAARAAAMSGLKFDSRGEYEYYVGTVAPKIGRGEIVKWEAHPCFLLFPAGEYNGVKLRSVQYTADFRLTYADGTVEIVEVKSKFVRRMQRDYPVRRRVFLELIARPAGWKFTEIITAEDKEEIKRWRELAEEVSSCGKTADALRQRRARVFQQGLRGGPCKAGVVRGQGAEAGGNARVRPVPAAPKAGDRGRHGVLAGIRRGRQAPPCDGQHGAGRRAECAVRGVLPHVRAVLRETGGGA